MEVNSHISVTIGRRAMDKINGYNAQNLRKHHVPICAKKKVFSIFDTKKVTAEKQKKYGHFLLIYWKILLRVSAVI